MAEPPAIWDDDEERVPPAKRQARRPRLLPALIGLVAGVLIGVLNASVLTHELRLRIDGVRVVVTVEHCDHAGRVGTCTGSYVLAGVTYRDRLLLGDERVAVGQRVTALVDRHHPGDAATTGLGAAAEAGLLTLAGVAIAAFAGRRVVRFRRDGKSPRPPDPGPPARPRASRARVWEVGQDADEPGPQDLSG